MAKIVIRLPEPKEDYEVSNQKQINRAISLIVEQLNSTFLNELKQYSNIQPAVNQIEFTPWLFQKETFEYCKEAGIQLQSYSPITRGIKFSDERLMGLCEKYQKTPAHAPYAES